MTAAAEQVLNTIRELPDEDRSEVVTRLRNEADENVLEAWDKADHEARDKEGLDEAMRRMEELESGEVEALPWEDFRKAFAAERGISLD